MKKIFFIQNADSDFFDRHLVFAFLKKVNGAIVEGAFEGYTAIVNIAGAEKVQTLESNGTMTVTVTARDSALMPTGSHQVSVKLVDTIGRVTSVRVPVIAEVVKKEGLNGAVTLDDGVQVNATFVEDSTAVELVFDIGATGGISAYSELAGKPSLNGVEINGAKLSAAYGIADASDLTALETKADAHIADTDIHVTSADKMAWNQKATLSDIAAALVPYSTIAYVDAADQAAARDLVLHEADALAHVSALERDTWNDAATDAATAKADAAQAKADATAAKSTADAVDAKATAAATDATQAKADAAAALTAAQGVDAKATQAQTDAANALTAAQTAQTKAESVESIAQSAETKATAAATDAAAALSAVSGKADAADLTAHTSDTTAHVTALERATWNAKANASDIPDVSIYAKTADLAAVATSGAYSDLSGTPSIPSKTSELTNDSGFITDISGKQDALTTEQLAACNSGITASKVTVYNGYATSKANKSDIPTKTSELENNSGFLTEHQDISGKADDSAVVHITGSETIAGTKTFTSNPYVKANTPKINLTSNYIDYDTTLTATRGGSIDFTDKDGETLSMLLNQRTTANANTLGFQVYNKKDDGTQIYRKVALSLDKENNASFYPNVNSVISLGTTSYRFKELWANNFNGYTPADDAGVVHTSGNETIAGDKTFTSTITCSGNIGKATDSNALVIRGASTDDAGARLGLYGKDHANKGNFYIYANDGATSKILRGSANEDSLTWGGRSIDCIEEQGDYFIKYTNGIQICWGSGSCSIGTSSSPLGVDIKTYYGSKALNFASAFKTGTVPICTVTAIDTAGGLFGACTSAVTNAKVTTEVYGGASSVDLVFQYIAIGKWK